MLRVNDEFEIVSRFYFDGDRFKGLGSARLTELAGANFKILLGCGASLPAGEVRQTLQVVAAPADIALALGLLRPVNVSLLEIIRSDALHRQAVYYQQMFIPACQRKLQLMPAA